jgi:hypothetical protein
MTGVKAIHKPGDVAFAGRLLASLDDDQTEERVNVVRAVSNTMVWLWNARKKVRARIVPLQIKKHYFCGKKSHNNHH